MRPSRKSVTPAAQKKIKASVFRNGTGQGQNSAQRKTTVSAKRETVSLFGRFIGVDGLLDYWIFGLLGFHSSI